MRNETTKVKKTLIISAFPACGKTYLYKNQRAMMFKYLGADRLFSFCDLDSSKYEKYEGWEKQYADDIEKKLGTVDFVFVSQYKKVLAELSNRRLPFIVVAPDNSTWLSDRERQLIKQQWFGRIILRDNSFIRGDFDKWFDAIKSNYEEWTSAEHLTKYNPVTFFLLKENQYISDIIADLYWKKEHHDIYTIHRDECKN